MEKKWRKVDVQQERGEIIDQVKVTIMAQGLECIKGIINGSQGFQHFFFLILLIYIRDKAITTHSPFDQTS